MNIYQTNQINEHLTLICEYLGEWALNVMTLVEGNEAAAIIDTGMGVTGDLKKYLETLTDKPVRYCLLTHGDPDHVGGAPLFDDVYMSKRDDAFLPWGLSRETRLHYVDYMSGGNQDLISYAAEHIVKTESILYKDIKDGQIFDLGGIRLRAISFPGHSPGSMCFINESENYVLTGDAFNPGLWLWLDRCPSVLESYYSAQKFLSLINEQTTLYCGHMMEALPKEFPGEMLTACREVLEGQTHSDPEIIEWMPLLDLLPQTKNAREHRVGNTSLCYRIDRIKTALH